MTPSRILLVDTDILVRHPLAEYLRECGFIVTEALSVAEAQRLVSAGDTPVEVVLIDLGGLRGSAFELARWIRQAHPSIHVVMAGSVERAADAAAELCHDGPALKRPYEHRFVLDRIRRLLGTKGQTG